MDKWNLNEANLLREMYNKNTNKELEIIFNRSFLSIYKKARYIGLYKTKEMEFKNRSIANSGENSYRWKGGKRITNKGYVLILRKEHPRAVINSGYVFEHDIIMEEHIGRYLRKGEVVHHKNGIKSDNRIENLLLMTASAHSAYHNTYHHISDKGRYSISQKAKLRFADHNNHPSYKEIDIKAIQEENKKGRTIAEICKECGINKATYYKKIRKGY